LVALEEFERFDIFPRRYFYPSLTKLDYVRFFECPVCEDISSRILCLPLYHILSRTEQDLILSILLECLTAK
jgi:dTDP-4-amino-4,6-dideoxygalactose transaminase